MPNEWPEEPHVRKDDAIAEATAGRELLEHGRNGICHLGLSGIGANALCCASEKARGIVLRGGRRMASRPVRRHGDVHVALLGDAHHGHGRGHAQGNTGGNRAALVEDHAGMHAVLAQPRHGVVGRGAGGLLAAGREEPDVARRNVTLGQQVLERLHAAAEAELVVERATSQICPSCISAAKGG